MAKKHKIRSIHIEPAENGHSVTVEHEPDADDRKGGMLPYEPGKKHVFKNAGEVSSFVGSALKAHDTLHKPMDISGKK